MKRLGLVAAFAAAVASVAWFGWALATERAVSGWLDAREGEGWVVARENVSVTGYPTEFVTQFDDISLADPATGLVWSAPRFTLRQAAWDPSRIEAIWPDTHSIASPGERLTISAGELVSILDVRPAAQLALDSSQTRFRDIRIDSTLGWQSRLAAGQIEMTREAETPSTYRIRLEASDVTPPEQIARRVDPAGLLPAAIPIVLSDALVSFDKAWDLSAIEDARPQPVAIDLAEARAEWGALLLRMSGSVAVDGEGRATGEVAIRAENWPEMLAMAERGGIIGAGARRTAESALGFLAGLSGRSEDLDVTLRLDAGFMFLGPLPIGEAPRLRLR